MSITLMICMRLVNATMVIWILSIHLISYFINISGNQVDKDFFGKLKQHFLCQVHIVSSCSCWLNEKMDHYFEVN